MVMKIGYSICISKRLADLHLNIQSAVIDLNFFLGGSANSKKEKKGIENHKRYVWDMCGKYADCKHKYFRFS